MLFTDTVQGEGCHSDTLVYVLARLTDRTLFLHRLAFTRETLHRYVQNYVIDGRAVTAEFRALMVSTCCYIKLYAIDISALLLH